METNQKAAVPSRDDKWEDIASHIVGILLLSIVLTFVHIALSSLSVKRYKIIENIRANEWRTLWQCATISTLPQPRRLVIPLK